MEGPLFLFRRDTLTDTDTGRHGFLILTRNGVENFSAAITPADDLEITPEFIIYRPASSGTPRPSPLPSPTPVLVLVLTRGGRRDGGVRHLGV